MWIPTPGPGTGTGGPTLSGEWNGFQGQRKYDNEIMERSRGGPPVRVQII